MLLNKHLKKVQNGQMSIQRMFGMMLEKNRDVMNYCLAKTPMDLASTGGAGKKITGEHL